MDDATLAAELKSADAVRRRKAADSLAGREGIAPLLGAVEEAFGSEPDPWIKGLLAEALTAHYINAGAAGKAEAILNGKDARAAYCAAKAFRKAAMDGADISPYLGALAKALAGRDEDTRRVAGEAAVAYYARRKMWKGIDALLGGKSYEAVCALHGHLAGMDLREMPNLIKILRDGGADARKEAASVLRDAAEKGMDISFAEPALKSAVSDVDDAVGREAESALETVELRKGGHCGSCLDCRQGLGAGKESLETLATILKGISCCAGDVSHNVYRCRACGRYYLSTFFDHSDSGHGQFYVYAISENDALAIVEKIRMCPSSLDRRCGCDVHAGFLKDETVPVDKELRYSEGDK